VKIEAWMIGLGLAAISGAVGYGSLQMQVSENTQDAHKMSSEVWPRIVQCERDLNFLRGQTSK